MVAAGELCCLSDNSGYYTVNMVIFTGGKFHKNVGKTFHFHFVLFLHHNSVI